jgi:hypothetical protein
MSVRRRTAPVRAAFGIKSLGRRAAQALRVAVGVLHPCKVRAEPDQDVHAMPTSSSATVPDRPQAWAAALIMRS